MEWEDREKLFVCEKKSEGKWELECTWSSERSYERNLQKINHNSIK